MYVVPRRDRRPFFAIVYSSLVDHSGRSTINFSSYQVEAYQIGVYDSVPEA